MLLNGLKTLRINYQLIRKCSSQYGSSKFIRQQFLDFFIKENNHHFVKSSSVIPFCDNSLSFVNAGMNQFKNVLSGNQNANFKRVANSQKCIRVGGKHNDLSIVGTDSYHHTFFEMLGNWSFGDYFKRDACQMAWNLLTKVYKIPPERLYVTYFKGDEKLNLAPDLECRDIWRELGLSDDRIIGFGVTENFWEMGSTGPCGGCSEIHVDHLPSFRNVNRANDVNKDHSDLTELWNIVFVEYYRQIDGSISKLQDQHIDTGMGFERLTAFLQNKTSNYDSDLFTPIFDQITKTTGRPRYSGNFSFKDSQYNQDTAYRILADHSRMVAVALSDGMFPEQNQKVRRILRKCISISEKEFNNNNLLPETIPIVAEILGDTYPELQEKLPSVLEIIKYEQELFKSLRASSSKEVKDLITNNPKLADLDIYDYPGFLNGYREICSHKESNQKYFSGDLMFRLYSTFGFDYDLLQKLAALENMELNKADYNTKLLENKMLFNEKHLTDDQISILDKILTQATDNEPKYDYTYSIISQTYEVNPTKSKILSIIDGEQTVLSTKGLQSEKVRVVVNQSPFYYESGGQEADTGFITKNNVKFQLESLTNRKNCLIHEIALNKNVNEVLNVGDEVLLHVDCNKRTANIRNHTAAHLLNSAIRTLTNSPIYQKSSLVTSDVVKIELAVFGEKLNFEEIMVLEQEIRYFIKVKPLIRTTQILNSQELLLEENVIMVPGETYPEDGIRLVSFGDVSKELCCGTHAHNTKELKDFTFLNVKSTGKNSYLFTAATGALAEQAMILGDDILFELKDIETHVNSQNFTDILESVRKINVKLINGSNSIAYLKKQLCKKLIAEIKEKVKNESRSILSELIDIEMKSVLEKNTKESHIIHYLSCSDLMKSVSLQKATRYVEDRPVLILSVTEDMVKARCCIPKKFITQEFNAEKWLMQLNSVFKGQLSPPKGQNPEEVCNMKPRKIQSSIMDEQISKAIIAAKQYASNNM